MAKHELTLRIGPRGAKLLLQKLIPATLRSYGDERRYLEALCYKLKDFIDTPPPRYVKLEYRVVAVGDKPVGEEKNGSKEDHQEGHQEEDHAEEGGASPGTGS